jgi:hypothetical protein
VSKKKCVGAYRFSFNGQEKESEINQSITSAEFWMYDGRLGRRWNREPLIEKYPFLSSYACFQNNPILFSDPDGQDITLFGKNGSSLVIKTTLIDIGVNAGSVLGDLGGKYVFDGDQYIELGLDIGGIFDPTGAVDAVGATYYASKGEVGNTLISGLSILPVGDIVKSVKIPKYVKTIKTTIHSIELTKVLTKGFIKGTDGFWSATKYRHNLQAFTKKLAKGFDAHHTLPKSKEFAEFFKKNGLDVNDPANMVWRDAKKHRGTNSTEHTNLWRKFIKANENNPNLKKEDILKYRDTVEKKVWGNAGDTPTQ